MISNLKSPIDRLNFRANKSQLTFQLKIQQIACVSCFNTEVVGDIEFALYSLLFCNFVT